MTFMECVHVSVTIVERYQYAYHEHRVCFSREKLKLCADGCEPVYWDTVVVSAYCLPSDDDHAKAYVRAIDGDDEDNVPNFSEYPPILDIAFDVPTVCKPYVWYDWFLEAQFSTNLSRKTSMENKKIKWNQYFQFSMLNFKFWLKIK